MGIDKNAVQMLAIAKRKGVRFTRSMQLGRQALHIGAEEACLILSRMAGVHCKSEDVAQEDGYTESLFKVLGAESVDSVDANAYERCSRVHDLNLSVDSSDLDLGSYDVIFDGGCIEHIFNLPQVVDNIRKLLKTGGCFISVTCNNNFSGHGFYQYSPELFYRCFSLEYGFSVHAMYLAQLNTDPYSWISCVDPIVWGGRFTATFPTPGNATYIMTLAQKVSDSGSCYFLTPPQQSDYSQDHWR